MRIGMSVSLISFQVVSSVLWALCPLCTLFIAQLIALTLDIQCPACPRHRTFDCPISLLLHSPCQWPAPQSIWSLRCQHRSNPLFPCFALTPTWVISTSCQFSSEMGPGSDHSSQFLSPPSPKPSISHVETISPDRFCCSPSCHSCPAEVCTSRNHQRFFPKLRSAHITVLFKPLNGFPPYLESNSDCWGLLRPCLTRESSLFQLPCSVSCSVTVLWPSWPSFCQTLQAHSFKIGSFLCLKCCSPRSLCA